MTYGCAHVAGDYPISTSFLTDGADALADDFGTNGFGAIKLHMSQNYATDYPNQTWSAVPTSLKTLAQTTEFAYVFGRFNKIFINAWSFTNGVSSPWAQDGVSATQHAAEYTEIYDFVKHLRDTYSGKTFVLIVSEIDWQFLGGFDTGKAVKYMNHPATAAFFRVWRSAIDAALADSGTSTSKVLFALENNRGLDQNFDRAYRRVINLARPDLISLSLYEAINTWGTGQADAEAYIEQLFGRLVRRLRLHCPGIPIMVGEFGWPEAEASFTGISLNVGQLIAKVLTECTALSITDSSYWQLWDNEEISPGNPRGYYLIKPDTTMSGAGTYWNSIL